MTEKNNKIVSHTSIYLLSDILRRGVSLVMLPIYTRYLTPADYGVVELLSMLLDLASIIFSARVGQAVFRHYFESNSEDEKNCVIASALLLSVLMSGFGTVVIMALSGPLAITVFSDIGYKHYISLFAVTMFLSPLVEIPLIRIRAQQKPWLFFVFSITKLILQLSLNIYFIVLLEMGVEGVIYSAVISSVIMGTLLIGYTLPRTGIRASKVISKSLFSFSLPLKLATLGSFYMTFGDRYILNIYSDLSEVGIYALGYKFGFILLLLAWDPFENFWDAEKYKTYLKYDAKYIYQKVFKITSTILIFMGLCISIFVKDLIRIMADPQFLDAYRIAPIIIIAYILQAWTKYCSMGILLERKTMLIAYGEIIGVMLITIAYFTLIPAYGMYGAAWSTVAGFAARFYWTNHMSTKLYNMELPWNKIFLTGLLAILTYLISILSPDGLVLSMLFRAALVVIFILVFLISPILSRNEKAEIKSMIRISLRRVLLF